MKVKRVELFHVAAPLPRAFRPAWIPNYPQTHNHFTLLRVTTGDGLVGVAAGAAFEREREGLGSVIGPYLLGMDADDIPTVRQRLRELSFLGWHNWWVEAAFWDLKAKAAGAPLYKLLGDGETRRTLDVYLSTGERRSPEAAAAFARERVAEGFTAIKLRVHAPTLEEDVAVVRAAREAVGDGVELMVDANQGWRVDLFGGAPHWDADRALHFAKAIAEHDVRWLEEPLDMHDHAGLARLRRESPVPIAGGELVQGWHTLRAYLERGCLDVYQPDCAFAGGVTVARRTLERCLDEGLGFTPHTWTNGFGFAANLHVLASHPDPGRLEFPYDPPAWTVGARDALLAEPFGAVDGRVRVPQAPGLGVDVSEDALGLHGERFYDATPLGVARDVVRRKGVRATLDILRAKLKRR